MRISLAQVDIIWENAQANMQKYKEIAASLKGKSDLLVLPEMCANGFGSQAQKVAQYADGFTISSLRAMAMENDIAIVGSFIAKEDAEVNGEKTLLYFNRGFFIYPDGKTTFFDKRHLFRVGVEGKDYQAGSIEPCIVHYKGWNIRLIICYDLRFPVWCRNVQQGYDLLICAANWPECRIKSWNNMLEARATENQAYACGVNRVGDDGLDLHYNGASAVYSAIGEELGRCRDNQEEVLTLDLDLDRLRHQREKFPSWKDADIFEITGGPACSEI
ncbi:MAG: nitrilase family protein [Bacteroidales bacterium]|nr:nitrilase family protein [Bacteroidales bacterium]MBO7233330.1 nitrilase family protein [Bacteroidales bacterium]